MASISDAEESLAAFLQGIVYPAGLTQPSALPGAPLVKVDRGYPSPEQLDADMAANRVVVAVHQMPNATRNSTRFIGTPAYVFPATGDMTVEVAGTTATFSGTAPPGQAAGVLVNGTPYSVLCASPDDAVAQLAALVPGASGAGASLTAPGLTDARAGAPSTVCTEQGRITVIIVAEIYCPSPAIRDAIEALLLPPSMGETFLPLPLSPSGRMRYETGGADDMASASAVFRRTVRATVEVPICLQSQAQVVLWPEVTVNAQPFTVSLPQPVAPVGVPVVPTPVPTPAASSFIFPQPMPAPVWMINHNLGRIPEIVVVDSSGALMEPGEVQYPNANVAVLTFTPPVAGTAYLN